MSNPKVSLTRDARKDFRDILRQSLKRWGVEQRDDYRQMLADTMDDLADFPQLGRACETAAAGTRMKPAGAHVIYYRESANGIQVLRILHGKMDASSHITIDP
jgi:toxin ParE1/3/4